MVYVLYNPLAGNNKGEERVQVLKEIYKDAQYLDITKIVKMDEFVASKSEDDEFVIAGGDGTLNRFINAVYGKHVKQCVYFYPMGSGNDFVKDVGLDNGKKVTLVNKYMSDLPDVYINDEEKPRCKFFNGLGYGIDGYCCQEGDRQRAKNPNKAINYTSIAIKGILGGYKPRDAKVTVDGKEYNFKKVFIAPIMHGRYYGGGFFPAPEQNRLDPTKLSVYVMHDIGRLTALLRINSIKAGTHLKYEKMSFLTSGHDITVEFSTPCALQIDDETVLNVKKIRAVAARDKAYEQVEVSDIKFEADEEAEKEAEKAKSNTAIEEKIDASIDISNEKIDNSDITSTVEEIKKDEETHAYSSEEEKAQLENEKIAIEATTGENLNTKTTIVSSKEE